MLPDIAKVGPKDPRFRSLFTRSAPEPSQNDSRTTQGQVVVQRVHLCCLSDRHLQHVSRSPTQIFALSCPRLFTPMFSIEESLAAGVHFRFLGCQKVAHFID
jgi:hypothetical protein